MKPPMMRGSKKISFFCLRLIYLLGLAKMCTSFLAGSRSSFRRMGAPMGGVPLDSIRDFDVTGFFLDATSGELDYTKIALVAGVPLALLFGAGRPPTRLLSQATLNSIVEETFLKRAEGLRCVYKASRDGWSAIDFHEAVDGKGSGVVAARTFTGSVFGGYNPAGWRSTDDYYSSTAAFLWCLGPGKRVIKLPVLTGGNAAIFDYATGGPCFGSSDLIIGEPRAAVMGFITGPDMEETAANAGNLRQVKSSVGGTYDWRQSWPVRGSTQIVDLEVYCRD